MVEVCIYQTRWQVIKDSEESGMEGVTVVNARIETG